MASKFINEFKSFAVKGNAFDLAVGVIIGGAFGKIVSSLVNDVLMPPIGYLIGGIDFKNIQVVLSEATKDAAGVIIKEAVTIKIGNFMQSVVDFVIIAFVIFMMVRLLTRIKNNDSKEETPAAPPAPPRQEQLLEEIRDLLKK